MRSTAEPSTLAVTSSEVAPLVREFEFAHPVVLVVDDEPVTRLRLRRSLENEGCEVIVAEDGIEGLDKIAMHTIDLVLLDISMPRLDGFRTIRLIRQLHSPAELPVIMMTASGNQQHVVEAFDNGANDYVSKPVDEKVVCARLRNQLLLRLAQRELKESEERYALAARGTNDGMWDWNLVTSELYLSPRWRSMVGLEDDAWNPSGAEWMELIHAEDRKRVVADLESHLCGDTPHFESELRIRDARNSNYRWMLCRGLAVRDQAGVACRIAGSLTDITEGKVADALTGLPNRMLFHDRVQRCFEQFAKRPSSCFAIIYMDVDDFKLVNDSLGHDIGDQFLVAIAKRLESAIRKSEAIVARLGGDEFAVLVENVSSIDSVVAVAERLHAKMRAPFVLAGREILTRGSMGLALADPELCQNPHSAELLLSRADAAMYHAKKQTSKPYCIFQQEMEAENATRLELSGELPYAIANNELRLYYQPLVSVECRETIGYEALVRWQHPRRGLVRPDVFIPIAESNGQIVELGKWVLRTACQQAISWIRQHRREIIVSVNVSVRQLATQDFSQIVADILHETGLPPKLLKLEVTESLLMQKPNETIPLLEELRQTGVTIGIDDFGTGYSSLSYLCRMPLDVLKIDRSFVNMMHESEKHLAIVRSILALAQNLQLKTIAEGIETPEQARLLQSLGCDMLQGYLMSKPQPTVQAEPLLFEHWNW